MGTLGSNTGQLLSEDREPKMSPTQAVSSPAECHPQTLNTPGERVPQQSQTQQATKQWAQKEAKGNRAKVHPKDKPEDNKPNNAYGPRGGLKYAPGPWAGLRLGAAGEASQLVSALRVMTGQKHHVVGPLITLLYLQSLCDYFPPLSTYFENYRIYQWQRAEFIRPLTFCH